jgi:uncharacterized Ntn-hydrolase superfamily protein
VPSWKGYVIGGEYVAAGNMLNNKKALQSLTETFEHCMGDLVERLLSALEAGEKAGGDKRGTFSAALIVIGKGYSIDLKVDMHVNPIGELRKLFERVKPHRI